MRSISLLPHPLPIPSHSVALAALLLLGALLGTADARAQERRPNILFLFADDQRPDSVAAFGNQHVRTPNIDTLVKGGFRFRRNYCFGSLHGAVCVPSRAMVNSGRHYVGLPMDLKGVPLLGELLQKSGYTTFGTGKWHNGQESFVRSFSKGTSVFFGGMCDHTKVPIHDVQEDGTVVKRGIGEKFSSELFADAAIGFLESQPKDRPFYAYVAFTAPHDPRQPPGDYRTMYEPGSLPLPGNFLPQHPFDNGFLTGRDEVLAGWPRDPAVIRSQLAEYYGLITHMDHQIGRILAALRASGHAENTIIVYAADHGLALGSHGLLGKQSVYEHSMGAPLVFSGPGIPTGEGSDAFTYLFDIFPTVCELTGTKPPEGITGESLRAIWSGAKSSIRDSIYTMYTNAQRAVRTDRWKLIVYPQVHRVQLFDLADDPLEMKNLAAEPDHALRIVELTGLLKEWQLRVGDRQPLLVAEPKPAEIDLTGRGRRPDHHQPDWIVKKYFE